MKSKNTPRTGLNLTGISTSPFAGPDVTEASMQDVPPTGSLEDMNRVRAEVALSAEPIGSLTPPPTLKGVAKATLQALKGNHPSIFVDKLGERLAFERAGVRLYDALLMKLDVFGSWKGGPTREELEQNRNDELEHYLILKQAIEDLGADPTMVTPSADVMDVASSGIRQVHADPRITLLSALEVQLIAELADDACWGTLIVLARPIDRGLADRFEDALETEERHVRWVREWIANGLDLDPEEIVRRAIATGGLAAHPVPSSRAPG
jgi:hypothetical protein